MTFSFKMASSCAVAALALGLAASEAQAGAFGLREQSATGQGLSFAGAAAGGAGLGSMFWNPASMTNYKGIQVEGSMSGIFPFAKLTTDSTSFLTSASKTSSDIAQDVALPATYGTWQVGKDVWLGLSVNAPFGLATKYDPSWGIGRLYGSTSRANSTEVTPSLAYQINDQLSVGIGVRLMAFKAVYKSYVFSTTRNG
ncbi:MAG: OmpP1/FadL family transporter, partial [Beijerinckiaceae bacterium]